MHQAASAPSPAVPPRPKKPLRLLPGGNRIPLITPKDEERFRASLPQGHLTYSVKKDPDKCGKIPIDWQQLQKRLGGPNSTAWRVWWHAEAMSPTGVYFESRAKAAAALGLTPNQVRKALARLHQVGLSYVLRRSPIGGRWSVDRRILGIWAEGPKGRVILVHRKTYDWLRQAPGRGGRRPGAGRKKRVPLPDQNSVAALSPRGVSGGVSTNSNGDAPEIKPGSPIQPPNYKLPSGFFHYVKETPAVRPARSDFFEKRQVGEGPTSSLDSTARRAVPPPGPEPVDANRCAPNPATLAAKGSGLAPAVGLLVSSLAASRPVEPPVRPRAAASEPALFIPPAVGCAEQSSEVGAVMRGKMGGHRPPPGGFLGVPKYPSTSVLPPAIVPSPPVMPEGLPDDAAVEWLLKAFRGAVAARTQKPCWVLARRGSARKSEHWGALLKAARALEERGWRPAAWVLWRLMQWEEMQRDGQKKRLAPLKWVFSVKAMEEHEEWYQADEESYGAPRAVYSAQAQDILRRYQAMQLAILVRGAVTEAAIAEVVGRFFPGDSYDRDVAAARRKAQEDQVIINQRVKRGDWLWR